MRAYYDAYIRRRLMQDTRLEEKANTILAAAQQRGPEEANLRGERNRLDVQARAPALRTKQRVLISVTHHLASRRDCSRAELATAQALSQPLLAFNQRKA